MTNPVITASNRTVTPQTAARFLRFMEERKLELHSVTLLQDGRTVLSQGYFPFAPTQLHPVFSCSKSFLSTAVGFLYDEKKLDLNDSLEQYFPEYGDGTDSLAGQTTLRQLLTMSMGQNYEPLLVRGTDWVRSLLAKRQSWPAGSRFYYASMCTYLLSAVVTRITGKTAAGFLEEKLFSKLGIQDYYWEEDGMGRNTGGWGLHISTQDMARFGQFVLDRGWVNGESLLSEDWIDMATSLQIETSPWYPAGRTENRQGYGYQFWMCTHGAFRASGLYGQLCMIQPDNRLVLAVTSAAGGSQPILDAFFEAMDTGDGTGRDGVSGDADGTGRDGISGDAPSREPFVPGAAVSPRHCIMPSVGIPPAPYIQSIIRQINSRKLPFMDNEFCMEHIMLEFYGEPPHGPLLRLALCRRRKTYMLEAAYQCWNPFHGSFHLFSPFDRLEYATDQVKGYTPGTGYASYAWPDECTLEVTARHTDQAARYRILIYFDADCLTVEYKVTELQSDFTYAKASAYRK